jgi:putative flippase GtrA
MHRNDLFKSILIGILVSLFLFIFKLDNLLKLSFLQIFYIILIFNTFIVIGFFIVSKLSRKIKSLYQLFKFSLVGSLNTVVDLFVLNFLMNLFGIYKGLPYSIFKSISFVAAATNSYFWNKNWTFDKKEVFFEKKEYYKFLTVAFVGLLINVLIASIIVNIVGPFQGISDRIWANLADLVAMLFSSIWNFLGFKIIVFNK